MEKLKLDFNFFRINEVADTIKNFINKNKCSELEADISLLNLIDASKTALLCSTYHFSKFPEGRIYWDLRDEQTVKLIAPMKLKNMELRVKEKPSKFIRIRA